MIAYNPNDPRLRADPYPTYRRLRDQGLVHREDLGFWAVARHADLVAVWRNAEGAFSSDHGVSLEQWSPQARDQMSFIAMDPPEHTKMRRLVSKAFTPARIATLEPTIRGLTRRYLTPMLEAGEGDFVVDLANVIPVEVISELVGVPRADRSRLQQLSSQIMDRDSLDVQLTATVRQANEELASYYRELIAERRQHPRNDLVSALLQAEVDGQRLGEVGVVATLMLLGVAGNETTAKLLGTAWRCAWQFPAQRELIWRGEIPVSAWVEETLRWEGPSQYTARRTTRPVRLHDQTIPADARLLLVIAAGNRDERVFTDPDRFDLRRMDLSETLAFGLGAHFCLGAALARLEARVVLEEVVAAVDRGYDVDLEAAIWGGGGHVRGYASLPTAVKPRR